MTAASVMGLKVTSTFQVPTGAEDRKGKILHYHQIIGLILSNGHRTYGCAHDGCDYTNDNLNSLRPHLNRHGKKGDQTTPKAQRAKAAAEAAANASTESFPKLRMSDMAAMSVEDILGILNKAHRIVQNGDAAHWKARALKAEGDLAALRDLIRGTG
jgi:hypothetical protein